jgi:hypothetical protein
MTLPDGTKPFSIRVKWYLGSYRACSDATYAIDDLAEREVSYGGWKVQWAGICATMKSSIHLMTIDAKRCFSPDLREALTSQYHRLRREKSDFPVFWQFIDRERHNILKEYEFSAYERWLNEDGTAIPSPSLMSIVNSKRELRIKGGINDGRLALDVARDAAHWIERYLAETIRLGGFEPDDEIEWRNFLWERRQYGAGLASFAAEEAEKEDTKSSADGS